MNIAVVHSFWFGPRRSDRREAALASWKRSSISFTLIDERNLDQFVSQFGGTLHPGFKYLSANHKSDYLRSFLMWNVGGLYTDLKPKPYFIEQALWLFEKSGRYLGGYRESSAGGIALDSSDSAKIGWRKLVGNGHFVMKPRTEFAEEWMKVVNQEMNSNYEALKAFGLVNAPRGPLPNDPAFDGYPIKWAGLQGRIFHDLQAAFDFPAIQCLPKPRMRNYL